MCQCNRLEGYNTTQCCDSCHEDSEEHNIEACTVTIDDRDYEVCCKASAWVDARRMFEEPVTIKQEEDL